MGHYKRLSTLLLLCAASSISQAEFLSGNDLKQRIVDWNARPTTDLVSASTGFGYILGVHDTFENWLICTPVSATGGQLTSIVLKYLDEHPEKLHESAAVLTYLALFEVFPCKKSNPESGSPNSSPSAPSTDSPPKLTKPPSKPKAQPRPENQSPF